MKTRPAMNCEFWATPYMMKAERAFRPTIHRKKIAFKASMKIWTQLTKMRQKARHQKCYSLIIEVTHLLAWRRVEMRWCLHCSWIMKRNHFWYTQSRKLGRLIKIWTRKFLPLPSHHQPPRKRYLSWQAHPEAHPNWLLSYTGPQETKNGLRRNLLIIIMKVSSSYSCLIIYRWCKTTTSHLKLESIDQIGFDPPLEAVGKLPRLEGPLSLNDSVEISDESWEGSLDIFQSLTSTAHR